MNTQNKNLIVFFCSITLITACSNQVSIKSSTSDKIVIAAAAEQFVEAYEMAKKECEKNTKVAQYIPDDSVGLEEVAFNCFGDETAEETATEVEEVSTEVEAEAEKVTADSKKDSTQ